MLFRSVSKKHQRLLSGEKGTQTFYASDDCPIELTVMRGLLGFYIQEPTEEELGTLRRIEITSDKPWKPKDHVDV